MANKKTTKKSAVAESPQQSDVIRVRSLAEYKEKADELRKAGFYEVPGALGSGSGGGIQADYGEYISSRLACSENAADRKLQPFPLLHVSSGMAVQVKAENGHEGAYITWGAGNKIPNVVSFFCSLSPYTAAALKFNIDLCCGMGPRPMYAYTQYVGGNITNKQIPYKNAGRLIQGQIRDLQQQLVKLEEDHPVIEGSAEQMRNDINEQINQLRDDLAVWQQTRDELFGKDDDGLNGFIANNNLLQTFQQLYADMLQYNICFPEFELQQSYLVDSGRKDENGRPIQKAVSSSMWDPKITGIRWRNAKTVRLEQLNDKNRIEHVYISNQWLSSPEQTVVTKDGDFKIDALPALSVQSPSKDLERLVRTARANNVGRRSRPTRVVAPTAYNEYGHPYYPVPAWYSVFSGDVYTYASTLISDRKKRRDNANVIGRILYLNDEYLQRLFLQRGDDTDEKKRARFKEIVGDINQFLKNRDNMGEPLLAYTFKDADGKVYKSWEIVEVEENSKSSAEANKEELAEISSIILFAWGVDSQLIGNTPGTTTRSGGTDLRERYLLKQVQMATMQRLVLSIMDIVKIRNRWDEHLMWSIEREVLTTLDNSKTGITTAETE